MFTFALWPIERAGVKTDGEEKTTRRRTRRGAGVPATPGPRGTRLPLYQRTRRRSATLPPGPLVTATGIASPPHGARPRVHGEAALTRRWETGGRGTGGASWPRPLGDLRAGSREGTDAGGRDGTAAPRRRGRNCTERARGLRGPDPVPVATGKSDAPDTALPGGEPVLFVYWNGRIFSGPE